MDTKTIIGALNSYFNQGDGKVGMTQFKAELDALTPEEKLELASGACDVMGWKLSTK